MLGSNDFLALAGIVATLFVSAFAAYWAFDVRKALAVHLYRAQALGLGSVNMMVASFREPCLSGSASVIEILGQAKLNHKDSI